MLQAGNRKIVPGWDSNPWKEEAPCEKSLSLVRTPNTDVGLLGTQTATSLVPTPISSSRESKGSARAAWMYEGI